MADVIVFNSEFNLNSFLFNLESFLKIMPDGRPKDLIRKIEPKTRVIYFPIFLPVLEELQKNYDVLHIVWPHRWEFDKGPDDFFDILFRLKSGNVKFRVSVIGENFRDVPPVFDVARKVLRDEIVHWGFMENKDDYYNVLKQGHVVISTAQHEFYGVAMYVFLLIF